MGDKRAAIRFYEQSVEQHPRLNEQPDLEGKLDGLRDELGVR